MSGHFIEHCKKKRTNRHKVGCEGNSCNTGIRKYRNHTKVEQNPISAVVTIDIDIFIESFPQSLSVKHVVVLVVSFQSVLIFIVQYRDTDPDTDPVYAAHTAQYTEDSRKPYIYSYIDILICLCKITDS